MGSVGRSAAFSERASLHSITEKLTDAQCRPRLRGTDHLDSCCPAHDDSSPSLTVDWKPNPGRVLVCCQTGCATDDVAAALGMTLADLYDEPKQRGEGRTSTFRPRAKPVKKAPAAPKPETTPKCEHRFAKTGAEYVYTDELGTIVFKVVREECTKGCGKKNFPVSSIDPDNPKRWVRRWPAADASRPLYRLPEVLDAVRDGRTVYLVEGEKDADAMANAGHVATCNPGGAAAVNRATKWREEHTKALVGARVVIVADRDKAGYQHAMAVGTALQDVADTLDVVEAATGKDPYDHLSAGHTVAEFVPCTWGRAAPALDPADAEKGDAEVIDLGSRRKGGGPGGPGGGDGGTGSGGNGGGAGGDDEPHPFLLTEDYAVVDGVLAKRKRTPGPKPKGKTQRPTFVQILDADVRVTRLYTLDTGGSAEKAKTMQAEAAEEGKEEKPKKKTAGRMRTRGYDLEVTQNGNTVHVERVTREEWTRMEWVDRLPFDLSYSDTPNGRSEVRNAILAVSSPEAVSAFALLGWRENIDGRLVYVHAGGAIDANGPVGGVATQLPDQLSGYTLPVPPTAPEALRKAVMASLTLLEKLPARIAAPLLGAAYRAVLGDVHRPIALLGTKGTGKSSLACIAASAFIPGIRVDAMPIPAGEDSITIPTLSKLFHLGGDVLLPLDDLAPDKGLERSQQRANLIFRAIFNGTGRQLSKKDNGFQSVLAPRGIVIVTAEFPASAGSAEDRVHYIPLVAGEVRIRTLIDLSLPELAHGRAALTAAMAQHHAAKMPMTDTLKMAEAKYTGEFANSEIKAEDEGQDLRYAGAVADFAVGWRAMLDMATERGALTEAEAEDVWQRAKAGLMEAKARQATVSNRRNTADRFADLLLSAFMSRAHLVDSDTSGAPAQATALGWELLKADTEYKELRPRGAAIGWSDGKKVWLDPGIAYAIVEAQAGAEKDPLNLGKRSVSAALADAGVLTVENSTTEGRRTEVRATIAGKRRRVWELDLAWLFAEGTPPAGPGDEGNGGGGQDPAGDTPAPEPETEAPAPEQPEAPVQESFPVAAEPVSAPVPGPRTPEPALAAVTVAAAPAPRTIPAAAAAKTTKEEAMAPASAHMRTPDTQRFAAPAVVADMHGGHLADGKLTVLPLPARVESLADLAEWGTTLSLGVERKFGMPDDAQVWIWPDLAEKLGLPAKPPAEGTKAAKDHPAVTALREAGWNVGELRSWMAAYRPGQRTIRLVVAGWENESTCELLTEGEFPLDAATLAYRIGMYAYRTGMSYRLTPGVTGIDLALAFPHPKAPGLVDNPNPPAPARARTTEDDYSWMRAATTAELATKYVHSYDARMMYLGSFLQVVVGTGDPRHIADGCDFDKKTAGYWRLDPGQWEDILLPDLFQPVGHRARRDGTRWYATPTLSVAEELGYAIKPVEAYLYDNSTRYYEEWAKTLRDAITALRERGQDPDAEAVVQALKATYRETSGMLTVKGSGKLYRPDHRHFVISLARANLTRKIHNAAKEGRHVLAVGTDNVLYASNDPDPVTAAPTAFRIGTGLGQFGIKGTALMADVADLLTPGKRPDEVLNVLAGRKEA
ncbi:hypothetical protein OS965_32870 [Streptomyces sp. H27-G5]|uniref:hypothetical protein n=1 Tax=Streptomyces sp. H27-G5 TaxID=2996698 RepID=UPI0022708C83|nr:hypothetical protein [Streptomyces sp. H27-G5]MCY0922883.1 hypothetical protein [Streptomyces sp. H27-G5]